MPSFQLCRIELRSLWRWLPGRAGAHSRARACETSCLLVRNFLYAPTHSFHVLLLDEVVVASPRASWHTVDLNLNDSLSLARAYPIVRAPVHERTFPQSPSRSVVSAQWFRTAKNRDVGSGPLARPFAYSFACAALLALRSFECSLAHSLTPELMGK